MSLNCFCRKHSCAIPPLHCQNLESNFLSFSRKADTTHSSKNCSWCTMDWPLLRGSVLYSIVVVIQMFKWWKLRKEFFYCSHSWQCLQNLYWTFSLSKLTPLSHPKNALVFLSAQGWGARFFFIESIRSAATLWSCSKWKATEIWCLNVEWLRKWHWNCLKQVEFKVHYKSWRKCCVYTFLRR